MARSRVLTTANLLLFLVSSVSAGIFPFDHTELGTDIDSFQYRWMRVGIYSPEDAPERSAPGDGRSFIRFQAEVAVDPVQTKVSGGLNLVAFHSDHKTVVGAATESDKVQFCCTQDLIDARVCSKVGTLVYDNTIDTGEKGKGIPGEFGTYYHPFGDVGSRIVFRDGVEWKFDVGKSGMYYLYLINCVTDDQGEYVSVFVDGEPGATFMNPYGYLNGELYGFLPFFGAMALVYLLFGIIWFIMSARHFRELLKLQNAIAGVIALGMVEMATWYFDNLGYNQHGRNYIGAMIVGVIVSTFKRTVSRILVLSVSIGFGVVRPTLGAARNKVILLGVLYCGFSMALNIVELVQRTAAVSPTFVIFLVFPVAILDTAFYWWIFLSLMRTIQQLTLKKQIIKLVMYKRFLATLVAAGIISAIIIFAQLLVTVSTDPDESWKSQFIWNCFWHLLYFFILVAIAVLWRPTENNTRYAYADLILNDDEITLQPLPTNFSDVSQRTSTAVPDEESGGSKSELNRSTSSDGYMIDSKRSKRDIDDGYLSDGRKSRKHAAQEPP
eukprot:TRINITY_DN7966_c0_g1_i3.p1 TRINITY_DN7966_c0_g1~~TRINITY_DN7966_c0_g1_i3.p1  ORF type:complete len:553 (+),score=128.31 TRINITY_DN7966_c0_g1_i3:164-1822(+)